MSPYSGINENHKKNTKPITADIVMTGAIVTVGYIACPGLSLIVSYPPSPVLAQEEQQQQQNITGIGASTGGGVMTGRAINSTSMNGGATQGENEGDHWRSSRK